MQAPHFKRQPPKKLQTTSYAGQRQHESDPANALTQLAAQANSSATVSSVNMLQRKADTSVVQRKGKFIGDASACHLHINIGSPHFKLGNNQRSRIDFGADYKLSRMQGACDEIRAVYAGKTGAAECIAWLVDAGCT